MSSSSVVSRSTQCERELGAASFYGPPDVPRPCSLTLRSPAFPSVVRRAASAAENALPLQKRQRSSHTTIFVQLATAVHKSEAAETVPVATGSGAHPPGCSLDAAVPTENVLQVKGTAQIGQHTSTTVSVVTTNTSHGGCQTWTLEPRSTTDHDAENAAANCKPCEARTAVAPKNRPEFGSSASRLQGFNDPAFQPAVVLERLDPRISTIFAQLQRHSAPATPPKGSDIEHGHVVLGKRHCTTPVKLVSHVKRRKLNASVCKKMPLVSADTAAVRTSSPAAEHGERVRAANSSEQLGCGASLGKPRARHSVAALFKDQFNHFPFPFRHGDVCVPGARVIHHRVKDLALRYQDAGNCVLDITVLEQVFCSPEVGSVEAAQVIQLLSDVRKLTDEEISAILQSDSESSDVDDPDFVEDQEVLPSPPRPAPTKVEPAHLPLPTGPSVIATPSPQVLDNEYRPVAVVRPSVTPPKTQTTPDTRDDKGRLYRCCVKSCVSGNLSDKDGLWLFTLPKSESTLCAWEEHLEMDVEHNRPLSPRVCFRHFDKTDFIRKQQRFVGLCEGAIPRCAATTGKPRPPSRPRQRVETPVMFPRVVRPTPVASSPTPQLLTKVAPISPPPTNSIIIPDDVKPPQKSVAYGKDGFVVTNGPRRETSDATLEMMEIKVEPVDEAQEEDLGDGLTYTLTLEDIQEELPWVVPDGSWKSDVDHGELVISKEGEGGVKKVVIKEGLQLEVFVAGNNIKTFNKTILRCADDLKVVLQQVHKLGS